MPQLENMVLLKTSDSPYFADKVYSSMRKLMQAAYDGDKLGSNEKASIARFLETNSNIGMVNVEFFKNGEVRLQCVENVRKRDCYLICNFTGRDNTYDPNAGYMKLFLIHDALWRAAVDEIVDVLPHIPYLRQDRKDMPRVPISAKTMAKMTESSATGKNCYLSRVMTVDLHADQEQGFYDVPLDALETTPVFAYHINKLGLDKTNTTIVSPDAGGVKRAKRLLEALNMPASQLAFIVKERPKPGEASPLFVVGDVKKNAIFFDDILDTGSSIDKGAAALRAQGAEKIYICATHAILSPKDGKAAETRLRESNIKAIITDTISRPPSYYKENSDWLQCISLAPFFADAIYLTQIGKSSHPLFEAKYIAQLYDKFSSGENA